HFTMNGCRFYDNGRVTSNNPLIHNDLRQSSMEIFDSLFYNNTWQILLANGTLSIERSRFFNNDGNAINLYIYLTRADLDTVTIVNNHNGLLYSGDNVEISNSTIANNSLAGLYLSTSSENNPVIYNSIIAGN